MDNVTFTQIEKPFEVIEEIAIIDRGNGEFTSMQKTIYDAMQAEQSTPTFN